VATAFVTFLFLIYFCFGYIVVFGMCFKKGSNGLVFWRRLVATKESGDKMEKFVLRTIIVLISVVTLALALLFSPRKKQALANASKIIRQGL
jgi:hypothetical protein